MASRAMPAFATIATVAPTASGARSTIRSAMKLAEASSIARHGPKPNGANRRRVNAVRRLLRRELRRLEEMLAEAQ